MAGDYIGEQTGSINDTTSGYMESADATVDLNLDVIGKVTSKIVTKGEEEFQLSTISLKGLMAPLVSP